MSAKKVTAATMADLEKKAVTLGDSYESLMERAGAAAADWLKDQHKIAPHNVVVVCGRGNNGGDGFVMARHLLDVLDVTVILADGQPTADTAKAAFDKLQAAQSACTFTLLDWSDRAADCAEAVRMASVVVDAVYGISFHGEISPAMQPVFDCMNASRAAKVALDMPSGVSADGGQTVPGAFRADYTLTFTAEKSGCVAPACGEVTVLDIGIPVYLVEQYTGKNRVSYDMVKSYFKARKADSHKGDYGHLLAVCGSYGMVGAAILCAKAALHSGVGLVTVAVPESVYPLMAAAVPEAIFLPLPQTAEGTLAAEAKDALLAAVDKATAVVMGCGLGKGAQLTDLVTAVLHHATCPIILDADGINAISQHILAEEQCKAPLVLTPHPGEMARLMETTVEAVQAHRKTNARQFAKKYGVTVALKGHGTIIAAPDGGYLKCKAGNPGMATGGSGDVLAGIIGSLAAQGFGAYEAAFCGVYVHGAAGDKAQDMLSQRYMLPSDIIMGLSDLFLQFEDRETIIL